MKKEDEFGSNLRGMKIFLSLKTGKGLKYSKKKAKHDKTRQCNATQGNASPGKKRQDKAR
jgi:hypothetical protein